jgi:hypothetical protein
VITPPLILQILRQPDDLIHMSLADWDLVIRQARYANLLAHLHAVFEERDLIAQVPPQPREHLESSHIIVERHIQAVQWEVLMIRKALAKIGVSVILLKGTAYVMAKLPSARGRLFSDIDIMVPKHTLNEVEAALMLHGWATSQLDAYDQRYYRNWMHELPPMQHIKRSTVIDVHHAILPETAYIHPDPKKLRADAKTLEGYDDLKIFAPIDMVLHSATHLFHEAELYNGLRDLVDIDSLLNQFSASPSFWDELVERAKELELTRPLFYALRYCSLMLNTRIPVDTMQAVEVWRPSRPVLSLMDSLYTRALMPIHSSCSDRFTGAARWMLFVRANWLRMPPFLLARHLFHKAFLSPKTE